MNFQRILKGKDELTKNYYVRVTTYTTTTTTITATNSATAFELLQL